MDSPVISPSKARRDAEKARDWAYVTSWLAKKYGPQPVPRFERNDDILQALLTLLTANDAADGEAELLHQAREEELALYDERHRNAAGDPVQELLAEVGANLGQKGVSALRDLAEVSVLLGTLKTDSATLGERLLEFERDEFEAVRRLRGLEAVQAYVERETVLLDLDMDSLKKRADEAVTDSLRQQTTQYSRDTKQVGMKLAEYKDRIAALERVKMEGPQLEDVKADEKEVLALQARVRGLEKQLADYQGLPPDLEAAKEEYQRSQRALQSLTRRRDGLFDEDLTRSR
jgi:HAUS augmin-like complex subunit 1